MRPFVRHTGIAAPLLRRDVDTDAIIPSREIRGISREGLAEGLFAGWRYRYQKGVRSGEEPDFVLNRPGFRQASILLSGANFGCGSSREQAVWALVDFGIRAVVAPSFAGIFRNNCIRNGLLPLPLPDAALRAITQRVETAPTRHPLHIDLREGRVGFADGRTWHFELPPQDREMLLEGLDPVDLTLRHADALKRYEQADRARRPWAHLAPEGETR